jgi:Calx-beta domain
MQTYYKRTALILSIVLLSLVISTIAGLAQTSSGGPYKITSAVQASGGGKSTGSGNTTIEGTAGQSAAGGPHNNSPYAHDAGFWPTTTAPAGPTPTPLPGAGTLAFSAPTYNVLEDCTEAVITVTRTNGSTGAATVDFTTTNGTSFAVCGLTSGSGAQNCDFSYPTGTIAFADGETARTFSVLISKDAYVEGTEMINLALSNATGGAGIGAQNSATLMIMDNSSVPTNSQPIDNAQIFVAQTYHDFLARQPDGGGLNFWTSQITQCNNDQNCINTQRINVSDAIFFELEFQQTGSYVFRLYRAAYGDSQPFPNPDQSSASEANKVPSYSVFVRDRARVVGGPGLAHSQLDLANAFVQRPEFIAKYPANLTAAQFIAALLQNIRGTDGTDLTAQTAALQTAFNSGGRGAVLYHLADDSTGNPIANQAFLNAEYNRTFVATQYFGYLRRDADIGGFLFWLSQVDSAPLKDINKQHAMVCSFITSAEYQNRFSVAVTHSNQECQ